MTRVCLVGDDDCTLQYELLSRETSRDALATYDLERPFENALAVRTVSIGAAISLLNDLQWYLTRFVDEALVLEPSVSDEEWLSRALANQLRNGDVTPAETREFCKIYGLEGNTADVDAAPSGTGENRRHDDAPEATAEQSDGDADGQFKGDADGQTAPSRTERRRLVEPLYVRRTGGELPAYDLRDVSETLVVRVTESEYTS